MSTGMNPYARSGRGRHTTADESLSLEHIASHPATPEEEDRVRRVVAGHEGVDAGAARTILESLGLVDPAVPIRKRRR